MYMYMLYMCMHCTCHYKYRPSLTCPEENGSSFMLHFHSVPFSCQLSLDMVELLRTDDKRIIAQKLIHKFYQQQYLQVCVYNVLYMYLLYIHEIHACTECIVHSIENEGRRSSEHVHVHSWT